MPIVGFHPVQLYLNELRRNYNHFALFFNDSYGGNIISVLWKPIVFEKQDFKVSIYHFFSSLGSQEQMLLNLKNR